MHVMYPLLYLFANFMYVLSDASPLVNFLTSINGSNEWSVDNCKRCMNEIDAYPHIDKATEANATLHCTNGNEMMIKFNPGIYVIEQYLANATLTSVKWVKGEIVTFLDLASGTDYQYRLYNLTNEAISRPEITHWFSTYSADYKPLPVKDILILKIEPDKERRGKLYAEVAIIPAKDRSCSYNMFAWNGKETVQQLEKDRLPDFKFKLEFLEVNQNNTLSITSVNNQNRKTSSEVLKLFSTLTCIEYFNNLNFCPPEAVTGLQAEHVYLYSELYDVRVHWNKPALEPDNYTIQVDSYRNNNRDMVVPGNATEAIFRKLKLGPQYQVDIIAESPGGMSSVESVFKSLDSTVTSKFYRELIIGVLMLITLVVLIGVICCRYYEQKNKKFPMENENLDETNSLIENIKKMLHQGYVSKNNTPLIQDKFCLCPKLLKLKDVLGSGAYGVVRLGTLLDQFNNTTNVAVKMLKDKPSFEDLRNFYKEILIMKTTGQHPNIVSLIGYCILDDNPVLVVEYCCKGDLQSYLRNIWQKMVSAVFNHKTGFKFDTDSLLVNGTICLSDSFDGKMCNNQNRDIITNHLYNIQQDIAQCVDALTVNDLLNFARQIATGMEFLSLNRIVHRDLAARNILVCADRVVKISDFGLSRDVYHENFYKKQGSGKLPVKWMAIEALTHQIYTTQSDVWSFGILLWEIITMGAIPYPGIPANVILKLLKSGYRMEQPISCSKELYNIMCSCWIVRPQSRPTFTQLKENLDKLISHHSPHKYLNLDDILDDAEE